MYQIFLTHFTNRINNICIGVGDANADTNTRQFSTSLIPTVTQGTPLVAIYDSSDDMPDEKDVISA